MTRLEFGRPRDAEQAMLRLPDPEHKHYWTDQVIEHLARLKETIHLAQEEQQQLPLEKRFLPMKPEDIKEMERISFRRKIIVTFQSECLDEKSRFENIFDPRMGNHKWWQISDLVPEMQIDGFTLVCVETNPNVTSKFRHRFDRESKFDLLLLSGEEKNALIEELNRNGSGFSEVTQ